MCGVQLRRSLQHRKMSTLTRKKFVSAERQAIHELLRECLACYPLTSSSLTDVFFFLGSDSPETERFLSKLLLHPEDEIATVCAHFLQHLIITNPSLCPRIVEVNL